MHVLLGGVLGVVHSLGGVLASVGHFMHAFDWVIIKG
jgi:hypothetical protein